MHDEPRQHPPSHRNNSDNLGPSDGIDYGGVDYHNLLSSLLHNLLDEGSTSRTDDDPTNAPSLETDDFREKIKELHTPLYQGCKNYSRLSFTIELYLIKLRDKMSDVAFGEMVYLLKNVFPDINIPDSFYETNKLIELKSVIIRRLMHAKMIGFCSKSKMQIWMLTRCAMSLDGNLARLFH